MTRKSARTYEGYADQNLADQTRYREMVVKAFTVMVLLLGKANVSWQGGSTDRSRCRQNCGGHRSDLF